MMKRSLLAAMIVLAASTAGAQKKYEMGNPNDEANYGYLKEYAPLKDYIDQEKYPNFKLGIGTTVSNYLNNATVKGMTNDTAVNSRVLCQLSYGGMKERSEGNLTSGCWRVLIFPGRRQPSIVSTTELNFCVRNGNRWTLCVNHTNLPVCVFHSP